ncbi:hypothetical protein OS493_024121 [Desmophyllum pertusum]|uniref:Uncharacterized protein n=1 Tax=Desmophyllum pertusum TaxID=174260 RepID=A0A9X0CWI8_9CNID|nr:hypothetical protein OS493_024121 [Desmophyllum pertusum]
MLPARYLEHGTSKVFRRLSIGRHFTTVFWNPASFLHTILLATIYVSLACSRTLLIKLSIRGGGYEYLPITVNIFAEPSS